MTNGISGEKQVITFSNTSNSVSSLFTLSKRDDDFSIVRLSTSFRSLSSLIFPQKIYCLLCTPLIHQMVTSPVHNQLPLSSSRFKYFKSLTVELGFWFPIVSYEWASRFLELYFGF